MSPLLSRSILLCFLVSPSIARVPVPAHPAWEGADSATARRAAQDSVWALSDQPQIDIGSVAGSPNYQLFHATHAVRLDDGRIVVANTGTQELRYYAPDGRHLLTTGRNGGGPAEFRGLKWIGKTPDDSVLAFDEANARISIFGPDGRFAHSVTLDAPRQQVIRTVIGRFADGSLVATSTAPRSRPVPRTGVDRGDSSVYLRYAATGELLGTIGRFPERDSYRALDTYQGRKMIVEVDFPFGREPHAAVHGDRLYFGAGETHTIRVSTPQGKLVQTYRRPHAPRKVTRKEIERWKREYPQRVGSTGEAREVLDRVLAEIPTSEAHPAFSGFLVDADGNLWIQEEPGAAGAPLSWYVVAPNGKGIAEVKMPYGFTPLQIGPDFVLGRWRDDLDVEHVQLYGLRKSSRHQRKNR